MTGTSRSALLKEEDDRLSGYSREPTRQRPPSAAPPDRMFYSPPSSLSCVSSAWWGHFKYVIVAATVVTLTMYSIIVAMKNKCAQGLTRDVFELHGQSEVITNIMYFFFLEGGGRFTPAPFCVPRNTCQPSTTYHDMARCDNHKTSARELPLSRARWYRRASVLFHHILSSTSN